MHIERARFRHPDPAMFETMLKAVVKAELEELGITGTPEKLTPHQQLSHALGRQGFPHHALPGLPGGNVHDLAHDLTRRHKLPQHRGVKGELNAIGSQHT